VKLSQHSFLQDSLAYLIAGYIYLVSRTTRWTLVNCEEMQRRAQAGEPFVACFWHGRMMMMPTFWRFRMPLYILGSQHGDGRLIRRTVAHFGVNSIAGSSSRGGARAVREMVHAIQSGASVGISPDGPRGPRMRAHTGMTMVSKLTGARIVPMSFSLSYGHVLHSWDRFLIGYPFGRGIFICGEAVEVPADADEAALEAARVALEERLNAITATADQLCGRPRIEPAPESPAGESKSHA
jgi:lysophospholipid acyltransferase (LPLAT)-like uncharacterized protein